MSPHSIAGVSWKEESKSKRKNPQYIVLYDSGAAVTCCHSISLINQIRSSLLVTGTGEPSWKLATMLLELCSGFPPPFDEEMFLQLQQHCLSDSKNSSVIAVHFGVYVTYQIT